MGGSGTGRAGVGTLIRMHTIVCLQQKGGVGKTTTVANVAAGLAVRGQRVLLVDLDPQANLTTCFGINGEEGPGIADLFAAQINGHEPKIGPFCIPATPNIDILRGSTRLAQVESHLSKSDGGYRYLGELLDGADYDYCLIDCAPSLSTLVVGALGTSDFVLVPMQPEYLPLSGLGQLSQNIVDARAGLNPDVQLLGVVLTMVPRPETRTSKDVITKLSDAQVPIMDARIPRTVRLAEGPRYGAPLVVTQPKHPAAVAYQALADEVMAKTQG